MGTLATLAASKGLTLSALALRTRYSSDLLLRVDQGRQALPMVVARAIREVLAVDLASVLKAAGSFIDTTNAVALNPFPPRLELGDEIPLNAGVAQPTAPRLVQTQGAAWVGGSFGACSIDLVSFIVGPSVSGDFWPSPRSMVADVEAVSVWPFAFQTGDSTARYGRLSVAKRTGVYFPASDSPLDETLDCTMGPNNTTLWAVDESGLWVFDRTSMKALGSAVPLFATTLHKGLACCSAGGRVLATGTALGRIRLFAYDVTTKVLTASTTVAGTHEGGGLAFDGTYAYFAVGAVIYRAGADLAPTQLMNVQVDLPTASVIGDVHLAFGSLWVMVRTAGDTPVLARYNLAGGFESSFAMGAGASIMGRIANDETRIWACDPSALSIHVFDDELELIHTVTLNDAVPIAIAVMP